MNDCNELQKKSLSGTFLARHNKAARIHKRVAMTYSEMTELQAERLLRVQRIGNGLNLKREFARGREVKK